MITEFKNEYRWLSNFEPCVITLDSVEYQSVEHAYMSCKSSDPRWKAFCADKNVTAGMVKRASRNIELIPDWDSKKIDVMRMCLIQKYEQEPFRSKLLATGNLKIQEGNYHGDTFWGFCLKKLWGYNNLGRLIEDVRWDLKVSKLEKERMYARYKYLIFASPTNEYVCNNCLLIGEEIQKKCACVTTSYLNAKIFDSFDEAQDYVVGMNTVALASSIKRNKYLISAISIEDLLSYLKLEDDQSIG